MVSKAEDSLILNMYKGPEKRKRSNIRSKQALAKRRRLNVKYNYTSEPDKVSPDPVPSEKRTKIEPKAAKSKDVKEEPESSETSLLRAQNALLEVAKDAPSSTTAKQLLKKAIKHIAFQEPKVEKPVSVPPPVVDSNWKLLKAGITSKDSKTTDSEEIWFDGIDPLLLKLNKASTTEALTKLPSTIKMSEKLTSVVAMDCEMVGVGGSNEESVIARVSIVNFYGDCVYDAYVKPRETVTNYRTWVSGIRPEDLIGKGQDFHTVQKKVSDIITGRILVGHALDNDLKVLFITMPKSKVRDTARYKAFRTLVGGKVPSLRNLAKCILGIEIQSGEHSSIEDAQVAMRLYSLRKSEWENDLKSQRQKRRVKKTSISSTDGKYEDFNVIDPSELS